MEERFASFVNEMKMSKEVFELYKEVILSEREKRNDSQVVNTQMLQQNLLSVRDKMKKIEDKLLSITNEGLITRLDQEWSSLETIQDDIERKINRDENDGDDFETILSQIESIFTNPFLMWKNGNFEIRQLLSMVRFGGILFYDKKK